MSNRPVNVSRGSAALVAVILLAACGTVLLFFLPRERSRRILENEASAVERVRALSRALAAKPAEGSASMRTSLFDVVADKYPTAIGTKDDLIGPVLVRDGYCFIVYLSSEDGEALTDPRSKAVHPDFWLIYAWPEQFATSGRRLFVFGSHVGLHSWENELGEYRGSTLRPAAGLMTPPSGVAWPLAARPKGWEKSIKWRPL